MSLGLESVSPYKTEDPRAGVGIEYDIVYYKYRNDVNDSDELPLLS